MFVTKAVLLAVAYMYLSVQQRTATAEPMARTSGGHTEADFQHCKVQLSKYRKFMLQGLLSFEDVCDAYRTRPAALGMASIDPATGALYVEPAATGPAAFFDFYQPPQQHTETWAFFKLLMARFNDLDFSNYIRQSVIDQCRVKSQSGEKRDAVVLGKKQRFHSWGGKRTSAGLLAAGAGAIGGLEASLADEQQHIDERNYF